MTTVSLTRIISVCSDKSWCSFFSLSPMSSIDHSNDCTHSWADQDEDSAGSAFATLPTPRHWQGCQKFSGSSTTFRATVIRASSARLCLPIIIVAKRDITSSKLDMIKLFILLIILLNLMQIF
ncbi:Error-prone DNA polymerase [Trichinella pseudospiralis]